MWTKEYTKKYHKEYRKKHKKRIIEYSKKYRQKNSEKEKARTKKWAKENPEKVNMQKRKWRQYPNGRFQSYKESAKQKNYNFNLTKEEFMAFWQKPCYYCSDKIDTIGLDRIDNSRGYELDNIVSCCEICNYMKRQLSERDFLNHCKKIVRTSKAKDR